MLAKWGTLSSLFPDTEWKLAAVSELCDKLNRSARKAAAKVDEGIFDDEDDEWFWRRTLVQYLFSSIEADVSRIKLEALRRYENDECVLPLSTVHFLRARDFRLNDKGLVEVSDMKTSTRKDVLFALRVFSKSFGVKCFPDTKGKGFQNFLRLIKIRNDIVHPKKPSDLVITAEMTETCIQAWEWFGNHIQNTYLASAQKTAKETAEIERVVANHPNSSSASTVLKSRG